MASNSPKPSRPYYQTGKRPISELVRRRWQTAFPFQGHSREGLLHKIASLAVREDVKDQARLELERREARKILD